MMLDISCTEVKTPFIQAFRHATAERSAAQSLWVKVTDGDLTGLGESCPREYVTGETLASSMQFANTHREKIAKITDVVVLSNWIKNNKKLIDSHPAAWCAHELALLDLFARRENISVEKLLGLPPLPDVFYYTAVLGDSTYKVFVAQLQQYLQLGFRNFKLKVNGDAARDKQHIAAIQTNKNVSLRLDANNLWKNLNELETWQENVQSKVCAVEEPLASSNLQELRKAGEILHAPVILDENCVRKEQVEALGTDPDRWIINVRVSKMGGVLRSLDVVQAATDLGVRIVVGAQVGETSILTRAALPVAAAAGEGLFGQEGAFGEYLLERDLVEPVLQFGAKGKLDASMLNGVPGWGSQEKS